MAEINDWQPNAANNNQAPPDGFPENMDYGDVNNAAREVMAVLARYYRDENGSLAATGTNDLTFTTNAAYPALYRGLRIGFTASATNTGPMTIQLNALPAAPFLNTAGAAMQAGSISQNLVYYAVYNGTAFQLITNGFTFPGGNPGLFSAASPTVQPALDDRVAITDASDGDAPKFATLQDVNELVSALFTSADPAATPEAIDRLSFQDASDANNPKTATIAQTLAAGGLLFRTTDASATPASGDLLSFQDVSNSNNARTATVAAVLAAAGAVSRVNLQVLTASGNYSKPANLVSALVFVMGGGGGGGAGRGTGTNGAVGINQVGAGDGGQSGALAIRIYQDADLSASTAFTVGSGGAGSDGSSIGIGEVGGDSAFGASITAEGGRGGAAPVLNTIASGGDQVTFGQSGSTTFNVDATGGQINIGGNFGQPALLSELNLIAVGGSGGSSFFGSGGRGGRSDDASMATGQAGTNATGFGAGGGGGGIVPDGLGSIPPVAGGNGSPGAVIILEFLSPT